MEKGEDTLVIDEIIDTFGDEELLDDDEEELHAKEGDEEKACEEQSGMFEPQLDELEEVEEKVAGDGSKDIEAVGHKSQIKYGFLWEFVRDLLHNSRYNPSIIRWENVEEGEFRIVDSNMVSSLWATVKGNKKMNYEKFSRAMRYYYSTNIFAIVENKRLVYKFGEKAKGWKPKTEDVSNYDEKDPIWCHQNTRCVKCLCLLHSETRLKEHTLNCCGLNILQMEKKRKSKKNINLEKSSSFPENSNATNPTEDQSMEEREKEALETLISLGGQKEGSTDKCYESSPCYSEGQSLVSTDSKQTFQTADKIQFLKTACEKSKTQTILQKREHLVQDGGQGKPDSDDEIEIVHEVRSVNPKQVFNTNIEEVVETVLNNKPNEKSSGGSSVILDKKGVEVGKVVTTREVRVNSKYQNLFTLRKIERQPSNSTPIVIEAKKMLRLNQKLSNTIGGQRPQECGNINDVTAQEGSPPKLAKIGQNRIHLENNPSIKSSSPTLADLLSNCSGNLEVPHRDGVVGVSTLKRKISDQPAAVFEPLPGLWTFMRGLLHNPNYNPKLLAWEDVEKGVFRIKELKEFYTTWKELKGLSITYEMLVKTIKVYDEMEILHPVEGQRCVYKFGKTATDWKPYPGEISTGKRFFPNQETWPRSRFYNDFNKSPSLSTISSMLPTNPDPNPVANARAGGSVTTLFTITPLDSSATNFSEMKVMSDNSRIVKSNSIIPNSPSSISSPGARIQLMSKQGTSKSTSDVLEANCKVIFPNSQNGKVVLTFENGKSIQLERDVFANIEQDLRVLRQLSTNESSNKIENRPLKIKKKKKKKFLKKRSPKVSDQVNPELFDKKIHFQKSVQSPITTFTPRKLQTILPKPLPISIPAAGIDKEVQESPQLEESLINIDEDISITTSDGETDFDEDSQTYEDERFVENMNEEDPRRENVARCKEYREKKKAEVVEGENERWTLEKESKDLNMRYALLERCKSSLESKLKQWIDQGYHKI